MGELCERGEPAVSFSDFTIRGLIGEGQFGRVSKSNTIPKI